MYCNQPNHITHRVNNTCKWDREGVLKSRQMENNEVMQKCGPKFWQNSNFRMLLPCSPACLNVQDMGRVKVKAVRAAQ